MERKLEGSGCGTQGQLQGPHFVDGVTYSVEGAPSRDEGGLQETAGSIGRIGLSGGIGSQTDILSGSVVRSRRY